VPGVVDVGGVGFLVYPGGMAHGGVVHGHGCPTGGGDAAVPHRRVIDFLYRLFIGGYGLVDVSSVDRFVHGFVRERFRGMAFRMARLFRQFLVSRARLLFAVVVLVVFFGWIHPAPFLYFYFNK
jgi:hypothetical protein